ncbi:murein biosynthesis integral membrane protein MurJ [Clostridium magnum]|uniref:Probable lipid II flippase MurJ n=1 Tax=Clostridium magnum DSM 2767 TaxID=1121326 RepID=A0A162UBF2_9CLOT|nr:murein biosynthesis integral membrane protein MurJ [Clostridium magnum]KZL93734.1 putative peptidoglycan biosynthesis protein MurJ [Clostridium magnum DSM 2767]SHI09623.1 putative peptidoglycan lipid II flippase [Clostridium magnum DSM 2767]
MAGKKVIKSSIIVMVLIILGKVLALVRDALIAAQFGVTYVTDIYNFALGMVYLLTTVSYGLTTTFIPLHTENLQNSTKRASNRFVNNVINLYSIFTIIVMVLLIVFSKYIIYVFGHGFGNDPNVFSAAVEINRIMMLSLIFVSLQSVVTGVLQSHKEFYEPAAMAMVSNIVYVIYLVFLTNKFGIKGFAIATVVGFFIQFLINVPKYKRLGYRYERIVDLKDKQILSMFKLMVPVIISTSVVQLNAFVNRSFATNIFFGAVTVLDCANKINTLAYEVFAIGIAMIVYPTLSELAAKEDKIEYKKALGKSISTIMLIMVPAAVAIAVMRVPLITVIFKRGAFGSEAVDLTASALLFYAPAMIAYGVRDILNKAFYSIKDTKTPMINSFIGIIMNIIINIIIMKYMKVSGLTLATTISAVVTTILMALDLNKKLKGIELKKMWNSFLKILLSSGIMGITLFFVNKMVMLKVGTVDEMVGSLISLIISFVLGSITYCICLYFVKVEEFKYLIDNIRSKIA